ncbi:hypothetical protein GCM10028895_51640 [Pontibacter rugosus]
MLNIKQYHETVRGKNILQTADAVNFKLENGAKVPENFHVTEVGVVTRNFIDCGGTVRNEEVANFQLWNANDFDHRLKPQKLLDIIALSEKVLGMEDLEIEVEYQGRPSAGTASVLTSEASCCWQRRPTALPRTSAASRWNSFK